MATSSKQQVSQPSAAMDVLKWLFVFVLVAGGVVANYYYANVAWAIRLSAGIVIGLVALAIALTTAKGQVAWGFVKAAKNELRKVVWPTRDETVKTTIMVVVMVIVMAMILWGVDALFMWFISVIAGQRG